MISSLFAGISGLNANATAMTVIGDNIAIILNKRSFLNKIISVSMDINIIVVGCSNM